MIANSIIIASIISITLVLLLILWIIQDRWLVKHNNECQCQSQEELIQDLKEEVGRVVSEKLQLNEKLNQIEERLRDEWEEQEETYD